MQRLIFLHSLVNHKYLDGEVLQKPSAEQQIREFEQGKIQTLYCSVDFITGWRASVNLEEVIITFDGKWRTDQIRQGRARLEQRIYPAPLVPFFVLRDTPGAAGMIVKTLIDSIPFGPVICLGQKMLESYTKERLKCDYVTREKMCRDAQLRPSITGNSYYVRELFKNYLVVYCLPTRKSPHHIVYVRDI